MRRGLHRFGLVMLACGCAAGGSGLPAPGSDLAGDPAGDDAAELASDVATDLATDAPAGETPADATLPTVTTCRDCHLHLAKLIASVEAEPPPVEVGEQGKGEC